jgi:elongation factor G
MAFRLASQDAFSQAMGKAQPVLLEPVVNVRVVAQQALHVNAAWPILAARGGEPHLAHAALVAIMKLSSLLGFEDELERLSGGTARLTMTFSHYTPIDIPAGDPPFGPAAAKRQ